MTDKPKPGYATAIHEAGHCVAHHLLGVEVLFVTIGNTDGNGMTTVEEPSVTENAVIGGFAGPWAQKFFSDAPPTQAECSDDFRQINRLLGISKTDQPPTQLALRASLREKSRELVIANEKNIRAVADFLFEWGYIGHWPGGETAAKTLRRLVAKPPKPYFEQNNCE